MNDEKFFPATIMPDKDWWHVLWPDPDAVLSAIGIKAGMDVVDLCCGDGHFTLPLCSLVQSGQVWAVDLDAKLLDEARQACARHPNFHAILGDARELPVQIDAPVDFVFIANAFHGVPEKTALSSAVHEVLKPEGRFAVINWYPLPREETMVLGQPRGPDAELRMDPEDVRSAVEPAGFRHKEVVDVGPYHYAAIFVRAGATE
ncbi:class I SAM-dependent methyltransferase [Thiolapillus sp.]